MKTRTAPDSSKQLGGGQKGFWVGHIANIEPEAPKAWSLRRRGSRRRGNGERVRLQPTGGKIPQWGPELRRKRFYCFLGVSERLSFQRLLKINVVQSRPLVEKTGFAQWLGSDPLRQLHW